MKRYIAVPFIIMSIFLSSCKEPAALPDRNAEKAEVEMAIRNSIGWAKDKDLALLYSVIAKDSAFLQVEPRDRVVRGFDEFRLAEPFWMNENFRAVRYDIRDLTINFSRSYDVAWFYCILDDINEWMGEPANWENTRWTGVLEKRDGKWVLVQQHFSFARE